MQVRSESTRPAASAESYPATAGEMIPATTSEPRHNGCLYARGNGCHYASLSTTGVTPARDDDEGSNLCLSAVSFAHFSRAFVNATRASNSAPLPDLASCISMTLLSLAMHPPPLHPDPVSAPRQRFWAPHMYAPPLPASRPHQSVPADSTAVQSSYEHDVHPRRP